MPAAAIVILGVAGFLFLARPAKSPGAVANAKSLAALPSVPVARVVRRDLSLEVNLQAEFRPECEVELHSKISGFLQKMNVDIGDRVKAGQVLATLEVPELQDELHNALASQLRAEADYTNAHLAFTRLQTVDRGHPDLVAQQDLDAAAARDAAGSAAIAEARAEVEKFRTLAAYTTITAPFDGVITRRYADPGALIQAGTTSETQSMPLVRVSGNYRLRLDFYVSVDNVKDVHIGGPVDVRVESLAGRMLRGKIARFSGKVEEDTRKMTVEVNVDNPDLELVPGMYATAMLQTDVRPGALSIPIEAAAVGKKDTVYVVNGGGQIEERKITLGIETPGDYEVLSGLKEGELVLMGNPDQLKPGDKVETKLVNIASAQ